MNATTAIANHLNVAADAIAEIQEWASVLWVRVRGLGARFVSKKVMTVDSVSYKTITLKPVTKAVMEVHKNGAFYKRMTINNFSLTCLDIPAKVQDVILFDLNKISGKGNIPTASARTDSAKRSRLNPEWVNYNNVVNEGAEGYNPHRKYL